MAMNCEEIIILFLNNLKRRYCSDQGSVHLLYGIKYTFEILTKTC